MIGGHTAGLATCPACWLARAEGQDSNKRKDPSVWGLLCAKIVFEDIIIYASERVNRFCLEQMRP